MAGSQEDIQHLQYMYYIYRITFPKTYPLFLTRNKGLKTRCNSKAQLVYERWLILGMDLNFDPCFKRGLIY